MQGRNKCWLLPQLVQLVYGITVADYISLYFTVGFKRWVELWALLPSHEGEGWEVSGWGTPPEGLPLSGTYRILRGKGATGGGGLALVSSAETNWMLLMTLLEQGKLHQFAVMWKGKLSYMGMSTSPWNCQLHTYRTWRGPFYLSDKYGSWFILTAGHYNSCTRQTCRYRSYCTA